MPFSGPVGGRIAPRRVNRTLVAQRDGQAQPRWPARARDGRETRRPGARFGARGAARRSSRRALRGRTVGPAAGPSRGAGRAPAARSCRARRRRPAPAPRPGEGRPCRRGSPTGRGRAVADLPADEQVPGGAGRHRDAVGEPVLQRDEEACGRAVRVEPGELLELERGLNRVDEREDRLEKPTGTSPRAAPRPSISRSAGGALGADRGAAAARHAVRRGEVPGRADGHQRRDVVRPPCGEPDGERAAHAVAHDRHRPPGEPARPRERRQQPFGAVGARSNAASPGPGVPQSSSSGRRPCAGEPAQHRALGQRGRGHRRG